MNIYFLHLLLSSFLVYFSQSDICPLRITLNSRVVSDRIADANLVIAVMVVCVLQKCVAGYS